MTRRKSNHGRKLMAPGTLTRAGSNLAGTLIAAGTKAIKEKAAGDLMSMMDYSGNQLGQMGYDTLKTYAQIYGKNAKQRYGQLPFMGGSIPKGVVQRNIPTNVATSIRLTPAQYGRAASHPNHGPGLRVTGTELVCGLKKNGILSSGCFYNNAANPYAQIYLNPLAKDWNGSNLVYLFQRLKLIASCFDLFAFRKVTLTFVPDAGANSLGSFAIGYCRDGGEAAADVPTIEAVLDTSPSILSPTSTGFSFDIPCGGRGDDIYYINRSATPNLSDNRMNFQGSIFGRNQSGSDSNPFGTVLITYTIDLYSPCKSAATLASTPPLEDDAVL